MIRFRLLLARACLRLAPRAWRDRYGDEVLLLIEDAYRGIRDLVDVAVTALRSRGYERGGGDIVAPRVNPWLGAIAAVAAVVVAAPTALFIGLNLFGEPVWWLSGIRLPADVSMIGWLEWLPYLPAAALLIAVTPTLRVRVRRDPRATATVTVRVLAIPRWLAAVIFGCGVVLAAVALYGISETVLEAVR